MKKDAEANADADKKVKEEVDKLNSADQMIFQTEKQLKEFSDKLSDDKKAPIEEALKELKAAHESKNIESIDTMMRRLPGVEIIFIESGGDNLAATFSPELADITIYVIDVSAGEKIPRKGGPGITRSDMFVINKTDLANMVGANLSVMESDTRKMRPERPYIFSNMKTGVGVDAISEFVLDLGGFC